MIYFAEIRQAPCPHFTVAEYWKSSNAEACAKKLSQILTNLMDKGGGELVSEFMWGIEDRVQNKIRHYLLVDFSVLHHKFYL